MKRNQKPFPSILRRIKASKVVKVRTNDDCVSLFILLAAAKTAFTIIAQAAENFRPLRPKAKYDIGNLDINWRPPLDDS